MEAFFQRLHYLVVTMNRKSQALSANSFLIAAPSQAPRNFSAIAVTSTIITASWQLPPAHSRNGIIIGFKLFYKKRGSAGLATTLTIKNGTALSKNVSGLDIYTEYEFEVLASTSVGDGPKSSPMVVVITLKDGKNFKVMFKSFLTESACCSDSEKT